MTTLESDGPPAGSSHQIARATATTGLRVCPIKPGAQHPPMKSWQNAASTEPRTIDAWFGGLYRGHGVGIAMGPQPDGRNVFAIDIDQHDPAKDGFEELHDLESEYGALPDTVTSITGGGGQHRLFTAPAGAIVRNQQNQGNRVAPGIDVRGDGGQIVVSPTVHPKTARRYEWDEGRAPWEIDIAPAPQWLLDRVTERPAPTPTASTKPLTTTTQRLDTGDSIAAEMRQWWDWRHELTARGWTCDRDTGGDTYWTRPGKDPRDGHSAVLHGNDCLVVFTTDIPQTWLSAATRTVDGSGWSFSPFGFYAASTHNGDRSQAARTLRREANAATAPLGTTSPPSPAAQIAADIGDQIDGTVDDWQRHDLAALAQQIESGEYEPELPTIGRIEHSDIGILYPGRLHSIFGPPGGSKTWAALAVVAETLTDGGRVLMIDWEDSDAGTTTRLMRLGCTADDLARFDYRQPATSLAYGWTTLMASADPWDLVVIDSTGEALASQGVNPNDDGEVAGWMALVKKIARSDSQPAVLMLDHVPKANETPAAFAIGSQRKLAAITGASYRCDTMVEPAKGKDGKVKLVVAKDRLGHRAKGSTACELHIADTDGGGISITIKLSDAQAAAERGEKFRPTVLMERVSKHVEMTPGSSGRQIEAMVAGKAGVVRQAIQVLIEEGHMVAQRGARNSIQHTIVRPFRESEHTLPPVDNFDPSSDEDLFDAPQNRVRPTASPPRPEGSGRTSDRVRPTASPRVNERDAGDALDGSWDARPRPPETGRTQTTPVAPNVLADPDDDIGLF